MRHALAAFLALALAAGCCGRARGEPAPFAGTYVYGDNLTDMTVDFATGTTPFDLTGATLTLYASTTIAGRTYTFAVVGDLVDALAGTARFEDLGTAARNPGARGTDNYWARIRIVRAGETGWSTPLRFAVTKAPQ